MAAMADPLPAAGGPRHTLQSRVPIAYHPSSRLVTTAQGRKDGAPNDTRDATREKDPVARCV